MSRPWTLMDDARLRLFHAQGKDDKGIARLIGRHAKSVRIHRNALGLRPNGKPGPPKGTPKTRAFKAMKREHQLRRWREDEEYRRIACEALARGRATVMANCWRMPSDPNERRIYKKIRAQMGAEFAKRAIRLSSITEASIVR